jgi:hypothetical protein
MNQPLIEQPEHDFAKPFTDMASAIERNKDLKFGGAVVIVPPSGDPIHFMTLDQSASLAQFYATIKTRIDIVLNEIEQKARLTQGFR